MATESNGSTCTLTVPHRLFTEEILTRGPEIPGAQEESPDLLTPAAGPAGYYMQLRLRHGLQVVPILVNLKVGRPGLHRKLLAEGFEPGTAQFRLSRLQPCGLSGRGVLVGRGTTRLGSRCRHAAWSMES